MSLTSSHNLDSMNPIVAVSVIPRLQIASVGEKAGLSLTSSHNLDSMTPIVAVSVIPRLQIL